VPLQPEICQTSKSNYYFVRNRLKSFNNKTIIPMTKVCPTYQHKQATWVVLVHGTSESKSLAFEEGLFFFVFHRLSILESKQSHISNLFSTIWLSPKCLTKSCILKKLGDWPSSSMYYSITIDAINLIFSKIEDKIFFLITV